MAVALVCVTNQIPDPERAWPVLHERLAQVWEQKDITSIRVLLVSPNDTEVMAHSTVPVEIRLLEYATIKSWSDKWMTDLLVTMGEQGPDLEIFAQRLDKHQSPVEWRLERIGMVVFIRSEWQAGVHTPLLLEAHRRDLSVVRIDPSTYEVLRVNKPVSEPMKEGE